MKTAEFKGAAKDAEKPSRARYLRVGDIELRLGKPVEVKDDEATAIEEAAKDLGFEVEITSGKSASGANSGAGDKQ